MAVFVIEIHEDWEATDVNFIEAASKDAIREVIFAEMMTLLKKHGPLNEVYTHFHIGVTCRGLEMGDVLDLNHDDVELLFYMEERRNALTVADIAIKIDSLEEYVAARVRPLGV